MTTAIGKTSVIPWRRRYSIALSLQTEAQQARTASNRADYATNSQDAFRAVRQGCGSHRPRPPLMSEPPPQVSQPVVRGNQRSLKTGRERERLCTRPYFSVPNLRNRSREGVSSDTETIRHGETKSSAPRQRRPFPPTRERFWAPTSSSQRITATPFSEAAHAEEPQPL